MGSTFLHYRRQPDAPMIEKAIFSVFSNLVHPQYHPWLPFSHDLSPAVFPTSTLG
jgi:hypothetical protein